MIKIKINSKGIDQLLKSQGVSADLTRRAHAVAAAAGPGMEVETRIGRTRARASVVTATTEARRAEANHRRLTAALVAGRG